MRTTVTGAGTVGNMPYVSFLPFGGNFLLTKCLGFSLFYRDFQWQTDKISAVFKPCTAMGSAFSVSAELDCEHTLCAYSVLPLLWSPRIPEAAASSCCFPHMAAVVFPYSARPKSLSQGCCSLTQEVDLASACSRYLEILSLVCVSGLLQRFTSYFRSPWQVSRDNSAISLECVSRPDQALMCGLKMERYLRSL